MLFRSSQSRYEERDEYAEDVTGEMIEQMGAILASEDVAAMRKFMDEHPQCNVQVQDVLCRNFTLSSVGYGVVVDALCDLYTKNVHAFCSTLEDSTSRTF